MTETMGIVSAIDGDYAVVETSQGGCGRCQEKGGCGGANIGQMFCTAPKNWRVLNPRGAKVGDQVRIAVGDGALSATATLVYLLPLALLFSGALLGSLFAAESGAIAGAFFGLMLAWRWIIHRQKQRYCDPRFHPHIL